MQTLLEILVAVSASLKEAPESPGKTLNLLRPCTALQGQHANHFDIHRSQTLSRTMVNRS